MDSLLSSCPPSTLLQSASLRPFELVKEETMNHYKEWNMVVGKTRSSLLWLLGVSFIFLLAFICSPHPLLLISKANLNVWHPAANETITNGNVADCDLFNGKWVRDFGGSAYTNVSCRTLPESKNCGKYGKDQDFVDWRWKPHECDLPRFDAKAFFDIVRGKTMAFVSDSVGRNQMNSLLCLLSQVEDPLEVINDDDRIKSWYFQSYDFILMLLWSRHLVVGTERVINGSASESFDLHLDKVDTIWSEKLPVINYLIFSDGHWFFRKLYLYENDKIVGCVQCSEANLTDLGNAYAIRKAFRTVLQFISKCEACEGLLTLVRTFTPAHFENGAWDGGGYCNRTRPFNESAVSLSGTVWKLRSAQVEELESLRMAKRRKGFGLLDVTKAMMMRPDAHPGLHWNNQWMKGYSDCVHWCLPGAIDTWNEMLLALLMRGSLQK